MPCITCWRGGIKEGIDKLEEKHTRSIEAMKKLLDWVATPIDYVSSKVAKAVGFAIDNAEEGYKATKEQLIGEVERVYGKNAAEALNANIECGEEYIAEAIKKRALELTPTAEQGYMLKAFEVLGYGKIAAALSKHGFKYAFKPEVDKPGVKLDTGKHVDYDFTGKKDVDYDVKLSDIELKGDYGNPKVLYYAEALPDHIEAGRLDYRERFLEDLKDFEKGTSHLHHGPLKEDLYLVNYHDSKRKLGDGKDDRTLSWATHLEVGERIKSLKELHQHLALVKPDWGDRNAVSIIRIPKGTDVTFISGKAVEQTSIGGDKFRGGAFQVRLRDFDEKWVVTTDELNFDKKNK